MVRKVVVVMQRYKKGGHLVSTITVSCAVCPKYKSRLYTVISARCIFFAQVSQIEPYFASIHEDMYIK